MDWAVESDRIQNASFILALAGIIWLGFGGILYDYSQGPDKTAGVDFLVQLVFFTFAAAAAVQLLPLKDSPKMKAWIIALFFLSGAGLLVGYGIFLIGMHFQQQWIYVAGGICSVAALFLLALGIALIAVTSFVAAWKRA